MREAIAMTTEKQTAGMRMGFKFVQSDLGRRMGTKPLGRGRVEEARRGSRDVRAGIPLLQGRTRFAEVCLRRQMVHGRGEG